MIILYSEVIKGILIPFLGTSVGSAAVFIMKNELKRSVHRALTGFAAGVMTAASVWSLLLPAIEKSAYLKSLSFIPAVVGFWAGVLFLIIIDKLTPLIYSENSSALRSSQTSRLVFAVTLHNIPEGMAIGVAYAACLADKSQVSTAEAFALALGIAIQNFPEGAIVSMPIHANGKTKLKSFICGVLSGVVEPIASVITIIFAGLFTAVLPYALSFAAGAMIYVVIRELVPEGERGNPSYINSVFFALGFTVMMSLDVALG